MQVHDFIGFTTDQNADTPWRFAARRYWTQRDVDDDQVKAADLMKIGPQEEQELRFLIAQQGGAHED